MWDVAQGIGLLGLKIVCGSELAEFQANFFSDRLQPLRREREPGAAHACCRPELELARPGARYCILVDDKLQPARKRQDIESARACVAREMKAA